jgi:hypothetical protein
MRTTIRIDDELLKQAKLLATRSGKSLTAVIEDALRSALTNQQQLAHRPAVKLTTVAGKGLQPGIDLDDSASLLSTMEEFDAAA